MRHPWPKMQSALPSRFVLCEILFETEGPELVLAEAYDRCWIGVASDHEQDVMRWIYAPTTSLEQTALRIGASDLHDCFLKPEVYVVDERVDNENIVYRLEGNDIPEAALPKPGLLLPVLLGQAPSPAPEQEVALAHADNRPGLQVRPLADVLNMLQRLYHAIAQYIFEGKTTSAAPVSRTIRELIDLEVMAAAPGSLKLKVRSSNAESFNRVNSELEALLRTSQPRVELGERIYGRYADLLELLQSYKLEILVRSPGGRPVFLAGHVARRRLGAIPVLASTAEPPYLFEGILWGLDPGNMTFSVYEPREDRLIVGRVCEDFEFPLKLDIGEQSPLRIFKVSKIRVTTRGGQESDHYKLHAIAPSTLSSPSALSERVPDR